MTDGQLVTYRVTGKIIRYFWFKLTTVPEPERASRGAFFNPKWPVQDELSARYWRQDLAWRASFSLLNEQKLPASAQNAGLLTTWRWVGLARALTWTGWPDLTRRENGRSKTRPFSKNRALTEQMSQWMEGPADS